MTDYYDSDAELYEPSPYTDTPAEQLLLQLRDMVETAPKVPLSASAMVSREEMLSVIDEAIEQLPEELRASRWLLKERDEFLTKVRHEGEEIINQARTNAEQMVQRTEIIKAAEQRAYEIVEQAETDARRLRHEVEDFCDQKLASFEIVLDRTMSMVTTGRAKLQGTNLTAGIPLDEVEDPLGDSEGEPDDGFGYGTSPQPYDSEGAHVEAPGDQAPFDADAVDGGYAQSAHGEGAAVSESEGSYSHLPPPPGYEQR